MHRPDRSPSIARSSARASPLPRSMGIWPIPSSTSASGLLFHSDDFASAWIWRTGRAAIPMAIGSQ